MLSKAANIISIFSIPIFLPLMYNKKTDESMEKARGVATKKYPVPDPAASHLA